MRMSLATKSRRRRIIKREAIENERGRTRMVSKDEKHFFFKKKKKTKSSIEGEDS